MMANRRHWRAAGWVAAALVTASCNQIFGFDEGTLSGPASTTSGGAAGGTGDGGQGAHGGSTASGGEGAGGDSTGGGGSEPTPCELWGTPSCGPGKKCSVVDPNSGATACVEAGPRPAWAYCQDDVECANRTWCDLELQVCKPLCQNGNDCPIGGNCQAAHLVGGGSIPGLQVCTAHCDPRLAASCNQNHGSVNCVYAPYGFDCMSTGAKGLYDSCSDSRECAPTLGCYFFVMNEACRPWCVVGGSTCGAFDCMSHTPAVYYNSVELGSCG